MMTTIKIALGAGALLILILILYILERRLTRKLRLYEKDKNYLYAKKIESLKNSSKPPKEKLKILSLLSRSYFKDAHDLKLQLSYSELSQEFEEKGDYEESKFCKYMDQFNYSPQGLTSEQINVLITEFERLSKKTPVPLHRKIYVRNLPSEEMKKQQEEEEEEEDNDFLKKEWDKLKEEIHDNRNRTENLLNQLSADKQVLKLAYNDFSSQKKINQLFIENRLKFKKALGIFVKQREIYDKTKELIEKMRENITPTQKEDLEISVKVWTRDINKKINKEKNPLKQQIEILKILKKILVQLEFYD